MEATANTSGAGPADEVPTDADFGIQEGEAEELQQKWVTWSEDLEENKRLVIDEYEMTSVAGAGVAPPASPLPLAGVRRHRRRVKPLDTAIANASPVSISLVHAVIAAFLFHRHDLISDIHGGMHMTAATGLHVQVVMGLCAAASTPASLLLRRMEYLVLIALVLTSAGLLVIVHHPTSSGLFGSTVLLGCAFGVTNAYATSLWGYFYGDADVHRIRYTSIAITTAASGLAVWVFALSRNEMMSYAAVMNTCALLSLSLAGLDLLALAPPGLIEAMVQRAPTWEQMLARRQHAGYFSISGQLHRLLCAIDALGRPTRQATTSSRREAGTPNRNQANPIINVIPVEAVGGGADSEKC